VQVEKADQSPPSFVVVTLDNPVATWNEVCTSERSLAVQELAGLL